MRICVIGCGYVGRAAAIQWKQAGHEVTVTTRSLFKAYELRTVADSVYVLDEDWRKLVKKQDVILLSVAPDSRSNYADTYLRSAEMLLEALFGSQVSQIIYTSSTSVYGDHQGEWVDEEIEPKPIHENAQILLGTEKILQKAACRVCVFRLGEIYGPGRTMEERIERLQGTTCAGTGEGYTNLIHLEEILSAFTYAVEHQLSGIYNLCNDIHLPRKDFYQQICEKNQWQSVHWDPTKISAHMGNKRVSNAKFKGIGWRPANILE